jgi:hypothetical protein
MKIACYYDSGNYSTIDTTPLSIDNGDAVDDCYLDVSDIKSTGVVLQRTAYDSSDVSKRKLVTDANIVIIRPEELDNISLVTADGEPVLIKHPTDGWIRPIIDKIQALFEES